ncbi:hypothetical protein [Variovorax paradoxus]|jgi:hypothetical protein|uniref:hypothetical protein n=1 Tax=Variovorax paradoxus TaxID=34073 RepID=UPI003D65FAA6
MKMIRNKNEMVSAQALLILLIGLVLIGAARRSCNTAGGALSESISQRFGTLLYPTIPAQELTQLASPIHQWLRDFASITVCGLRSRSCFLRKRVRAISRGAA